MGETIPKGRVSETLSESLHYSNRMLKVPGSSFLSVSRPGLTIYLKVSSSYSLRFLVSSSSF